MSGGAGSSIAYTAVMPDGFPDMLDITPGSVQRSQLDVHALIPSVTYGRIVVSTGFAA